MIKSSRLTLRKIVNDDFAELKKILTDIEVMYAWEHSFSDTEIYDWIGRRQAGYKMFGYDYFIAINENNQIVGQIGLINEKIGNNQFVGIGYILKKEFWHKGYAIEGAKACIDFAFNTLKIDTVIADIRPQNLASIAVAEKLGMKRNGEFIKHYNGKEMLHYIYKLNNFSEVK